MKYLKFFENKIDDEMISEIESLSYIMEDEGYFVNIFEMSSRINEKYFKIHIGTKKHQFSGTIELGPKINEMPKKDCYKEYYERINDVSKKFGYKVEFDFLSKNSKNMNVLILAKIMGLEDFY